MDYELPNCCYDYRYDNYEHVYKTKNDNYYAELEDKIYDENIDMEE